MTDREDDDAWAERYFREFGHDNHPRLMQVLRAARNEIRGLRDELDQQRTRAEAAEADLAELRKAVESATRFTMSRGASLSGVVLDELPMLEHPGTPYRYELKTSLPPVNDEDDGA